MFVAATRDRRFAAKRQVARPFNLPSPTGGINARDNYTDQDPKDAVNLNNVFPEANAVVVRRGFTPVTTGLVSAVQTLLVWEGTIDEIFAAAGSSISDSTGSAVVTGLANAKWQWTNLENAGGQFLTAVNGADHRQLYDGTSWTVATGSGVDDRTLTNVMQFKERLWFIQDNSLNLWYLDTQAIQGTYNPFPLGAVFRRGGYIIAFGSFSNDAGEGPDDYFAIATSNGEIAVYQGTDPTSATTWSLVGLFTIGKPIGRRCMARLSGDLVIVTQDGVISMQAALQADRSAGAKAQVTSKIQTLFSEQSRAYFTNWGWQPFVYPRARYFIVNVPQIQDMTQIQLVMNTVTGSWCQFTGMNAECWAMANDLLYFGGNDGVVYQANEGFLDITYVAGQNVTANVMWELQTSWQAVWNKSNKLFTAVRPEMLTGGGVLFAIDVDVDFVVRTPTGTLNSPTLTGMVWPWTWPGTWGGQNLFDAQWHSVGSFGTWSSVHMVGTLGGAACQINSFDLGAQQSTGTWYG